LIVSVRPATTAVPVRGGDAFGAIAKEAWADPEPLGVTTVIQSTEEPAVHAQPGEDVTDVPTLPPFPLMSCDVGAIA
jgi:hypothetical protein